MMIHVPGPNSCQARSRYPAGSGSGSCRSEQRRHRPAAPHWPAPAPGGPRRRVPLRPPSPQSPPAPAPRSCAERAPTTPNTASAVGRGGSASRSRLFSRSFWSRSSGATSRLSSGSCRGLQKHSKGAPRVANKATPRPCAQSPAPPRCLRSPWRLRKLLLALHRHLGG